MHLLRLMIPCSVGLLIGCSAEAPAAPAAAPAVAAPPLSPDPPLAAIQAHARAVRKAPSAWRTKLPRPQQQAFTPGKDYLWQLQTSEGPITVRLFADVAPMHVSSTVFLTELGYYDGLTFHRVIPGFVAQGGAPLQGGVGDPGYRLDGEFADGVVHDRAGLVSMANSGPGTDGSQFFFTLDAEPSLDGKHTIFGEVVSGMDAVRAIEGLGTPGGKPTREPLIESASIAVRGG